MSGVGKPERKTQNRLIALFRDELGYRFLGDWSERPSEYQHRGGNADGPAEQTRYCRSKSVARFTFSDRS